VIDHPSNRCDGGHIPVEGRPEICSDYMARKARDAEAAEALARKHETSPIGLPPTMTRDEAKADAEQALRTTPERVTERLYADEEGVVSLPEYLAELRVSDEGSGPWGGHYGGADNPHETIKCLAAWGLTSNAYLWTAAKYLSRADRKPGEDGLKCLEKAAYYLAAEIERRKGA
jgi:hypothetical protein